METPSEVTAASSTCCHPQAPLVVILLDAANCGLVIVVSCCSMVSISQVSVTTSVMMMGLDRSHGVRCRPFHDRREASRRDKRGAAKVNAVENAITLLVGSIELRRTWRGPFEEPMIVRTAQATGLRKSSRWVVSKE